MSDIQQLLDEIKSLRKEVRGLKKIVESKDEKANECVPMRIVLNAIPGITDEQVKYARKHHAEIAEKKPNGRFLYNIELCKKYITPVKQAS